MFLLKYANKVKLSKFITIQTKHANCFDDIIWEVIVKIHRPTLTGHDKHLKTKINSTAYYEPQQ